MMERRPTWNRRVSKGTLHVIGRQGSQGLGVIVLATVFTLSNSNHEPTPAGNSSPEWASPVAASPPHYILPNLAEETFSELAAAPPQNELQVSEPDLGPLPIESKTGAPMGVDEVKQYLWSVYQRSSTKIDSRGDFTWKDASAAARLGLSMEEYVIGGMDPDFREQLFAAGQAMDAAGIDWTIL